MHWAPSGSSGVDGGIGAGIGSGDGDGIGDGIDTVPADDGDFDVPAASDDGAGAVLAADTLDLLPRRMNSDRTGSQADA